ncbi:hypothetical protein D3C77_795630 [compost metagenome]
MHGLDVEGVGCGVEAAAINATGGAIATVATIGLRIIGVGRAIDQQGFDKAAIGTKNPATHQAAGNRCTLYRS